MSNNSKFNNVVSVYTNNAFDEYGLDTVCYIQENIILNKIDLSYDTDRHNLLCLKLSDAYASQSITHNIDAHDVISIVEHSLGAMLRSCGEKLLPDDYDALNFWMLQSGDIEKIRSILMNSCYEAIEKYISYMGDDTIPYQDVMNAKRI